MSGDPRVGLAAANPELRSMLDPRFVAAHAHEVERIDGARAHWDVWPFTAIEIGANTGAFAAGYAERSGHSILGIEWNGKHAAAASTRFARKAVSDRAFILHADARLAVPLLIPPESLRAIFVLFPDPWWKTRHAARRLLEPLFLRVLARRLAPGGALYVKSDVFSYLYWVRAAAEASAALVPVRAADWPDESVWGLSTRERKCMEAAIPFGRGYYTRRPGFDCAPLAEPEPRDAFPMADFGDPVDVIRGPAPLDREAWSRGRRRRDSP